LYSLIPFEKLKVPENFFLVTVCTRGISMICRFSHKNLKLFQSVVLSFLVFSIGAAFYQIAAYADESVKPPSTPPSGPNPSPTPVAPPMLPIRLVKAKFQVFASVSKPVGDSYEYSTHDVCSGYIWTGVFDLRGGKDGKSGSFGSDSQNANCAFYLAEVSERMTVRISTAAELEKEEIWPGEAKVDLKILKTTLEKWIGNEFEYNPNPDVEIDERFNIDWSATKTLGMSNHLLAVQERSTSCSVSESPSNPSKMINQNLRTTKLNLLNKTTLDAVLPCPPPTKIKVGFSAIVEIDDTGSTPSGALMGMHKVTSGVGK
jgi:hypothetical protein